MGALPWLLLLLLFQEGEAGNQLQDKSISFCLCSPLLLGWGQAGHLLWD